MNLALVEAVKNIKNAVVTKQDNLLLNKRICISG